MINKNNISCKAAKAKAKVQCIALITILCSCNNSAPEQEYNTDVFCTEDTALIADTIQTDTSKTEVVIQNSTPITQHSTPGTQNSTPITQHSEPAHPGTPPDDPLFGWDYYDDADDAYESDRNQSDAYPDDW